MIETTVSQGRVEWPIPVRRTRKRRDSRAHYHSTSRYSPPRQLPGSSTPTTSPKTESSSRNEQQSTSFQSWSSSSMEQPLEQPLEQQPLNLDLNLNLDYLNCFDFQNHAGHSGYGPVVHQHDQVDSSWFTEPQSSNRFGSNAPDSPRTYDGDNASYPINPNSSQMSNYNVDISFNEATPRTTRMASDADDMISMSDVHFGSVSSFDSMVLPSPDTMASSISEGYVFTGMSSAFGSPENTHQLNDLRLTEGYFQTGEPFDVSSPGSLVSPTCTDNFPLEADVQQLQPDWSLGDVYSTDNTQWSATTLIQPQQTHNSHRQDHSMVPHVPWNSQINKFQENATPGVVAFESNRGQGYETYRVREEYLEAGQPIFGPEPVSPTWDNESEEWVMASYSSSDAASYNSPHSQASSPSHASSPAHIEIEHHSHVFSSHSSLSKPKPTRGRQRNLTPQEKKSAREVREAKACWACHISKTKCSPCSPGKPCEQCARLVGKRRFCKFSCFNDPLESLHTFLVPDYINGHFTRANVEAFVTNNASSWGTQHLFIRMSWGYRRLLEADVVALALRNNSAMGHDHQVIGSGSDRPLFRRKKSPPLGIPLAAMEEMEDTYSAYIRDIVQSDLRAYVSIAYDDQRSKLPECLLGVVSSFYIHGLQVDEENSLLRRALEMHVMCTVIERSLILDPESIERVQNHLQEDYPKRSAPRCAQRQIKLAFFFLQRQRIISVLKDWGNLMWTIHNAANNDQRWATGFSVFLMLILVIDKTLGSAYYFCEGNIKNHGHEASAERAEFRKLVRLTQTELFERCKEIFHWKFKTRKAGKEACNPIRDGMEAFKGRAVDDGIASLAHDLQSVVENFGEEIRSHKSTKAEPSSGTVDASPYMDAARLSCIFLDDFLGVLGVPPR